MSTALTPLKTRYPFYLANQPQWGGLTVPVIDKYTQAHVSEISIATPKDIEQAIAAGVQALPALARQTLFERKKILSHCLNRFQERKEELAQILCIEVGKPIKDARAEVGRLIDTFTAAQESCEHLAGTHTRLDGTARGKGYQGLWKRVPVGLCSFISPFNFPLNLTAHKVAPAIAVGCPFILKPATRTPISSLILGEILAETDLPPGAFSILPCPREGAELFTTDERIKLISFTGSPSVGWELKSRAGKKKVVLELGGNAPCIVDASAVIPDAIERILIGAFSQSGQSCISVQRLFVHAAIYTDFKTRLVEATHKLLTGDPKLETTQVGPLISEQDAIRLERWIQQALSKGATLLCGGKRTGSLLQPTLVENVPDTEPLNCEEAFGPVVTLQSVPDFSYALKLANSGRFGLQAGVFTQNLTHTLLAWDTLETGGVTINEVPSWRSDTMPYGGVRDSGLGREGVRFAMEEMTELRSLVIRQVDNSP